MQEQPEPCQLQCTYGGQRPVGFNWACLKSRTPAQVAGCSTAKLWASCPALVKAEPGSNQGAMTQTHNSVSAQQKKEKCADMGNIPLDTSEAKE